MYFEMRYIEVADGRINTVFRLLEFDILQLKVKSRKAESSCRNSPRKKVHASCALKNIATFTTHN